MIDARTINKIINRIKKTQKHPALQRFIDHNRRMFPTFAGNKSQKPVVLVELNGMHSAHIAYSYLANVIAENENARIVAYEQSSKRRWWQSLFFKFRRAVRLERFGAYASFGTTEFLEVNPSAAQKASARSILKELLPQLRRKVDIEQLNINGVCIGNLIYDSYLMSRRVPTIEIESSDFQRFLRESIELFVFWEDYLSNNDVRAINVSHCVYNVAIPLRLAVSRDIPVFQPNLTHVYRLNSQNQYAYNDFLYFRDLFAELPKEVQAAGLKIADERIKRRLAGEVGVDMLYSTKSAYGAVRNERLLDASPRKKILIATHCFFDSPHSYGNNIFPDFYEWLDFLGKMTECTDYDWYIKTHPDYRPGTMEILEGFLSRYPKFNLLPSNASHHQIIAEGIDLALTVFGTIGFEYAVLGIPVINATSNNPHIAYDFNLHARDVEEYRRMLNDPKSWDIKIESRQVYEYYFMKHIYNRPDIFFDSYHAVLKQLSGYSGQFKPIIYDKWLEEFTPEKHDTIRSALRDFIDSGDFRINHKHFGLDLCIESMGKSQ